MENSNSELKNTTYEIFIGTLSIPSIINLFLIYITPTSLAGQVAGIMDGLLTLIFLSDFFYRLFTVQSKLTYFLRQYGWADLLASLPFPQLKILRLFRIIRAGRILHRFGLKNIIGEFIEDRAGSTLFTLLLLIILVIEFGAIIIVTIESKSTNANITTASDAIWYIYVTITTVGYGDQYPVTDVGRGIGMFIMAVGVGLFGTLTGYLSNFFLAPREKKTSSSDGEPSDVKAKLIELKQLLEEQKKAQSDLESKISEIEVLL